MIYISPTSKRGNGRQPGYNCLRQYLMPPYASNHCANMFSDLCFSDTVICPKTLKNPGGSWILNIRPWQSKIRQATESCSLSCVWATTPWHPHGIMHTQLCSMDSRDFKRTSPGNPGCYQHMPWVSCTVTFKNLQNPWVLSNANGFETERILPFAMRESQ